MSFASGPMVHHVSMETAALGDLADQLQRMGACVTTTAQDCKAAVNNLLGGTGADAFAGDAATAISGALGTLGSQMSDHADAANQASLASQTCLGAILAAAERVDRSGSNWDTLINLTTSLDVAAVMESGYIFNFDRLFAGMADALLALELPQWASETHAATVECVRTLHRITEEMVDPGTLGPPRYIPTPTPIPVMPRPVAPAPVGTASSGDYAASVAAQLATYLVLERHVDDYGHVYYSYSGIDLERLQKDHPDWMPYITSDLTNRGYASTNVQCVAFMDMVMAISDKKSKAQPNNGDAWTYWNAGDFPPPKWQRITNGAGLPQPGDIMVMWDGGPGHVAIVTNVTATSITFANANARYQTYTFPIKNGAVESNWGKSIYGQPYVVKGFIRQTGQ